MSGQPQFRPLDEDIYVREDRHPVDILKTKEYDL